MPYQRNNQNSESDDRKYANWIEGQKNKLCDAANTNGWVYKERKSKHSTYLDFTCGDRLIKIRLSDHNVSNRPCDRANADWSTCLQFGINCRKHLEEALVKLVDLGNRRQPAVAQLDINGVLPGRRVRHVKFGLGRVIKLIGGGDSGLRVRIEFDRDDIKTFVLGLVLNKISIA